MNSIRVGVPEFLSVRPLIYGVMRHINPDLELVYEQPGTLARDIDAGRLDAALVPSIEYLRGIGRHHLDGAALVARPGKGALSLVSRVPLEEIRRVAVDEFCRTPITVLRIVLGELHGLMPDLLVEKHMTAACLERYDAMLLSGDRALHLELEGGPEGCDVHNVSDMWQRLTGVPLVAGLWVFQDPSLNATLTRTLITSRNLGVQNLARLCEGIAQTSQFDAGLLFDYLTTCWSYEFGLAEQEGLRALEAYAMRYNLLHKKRLENISIG